MSSFLLECLNSGVPTVISSYWSDTIDFSICKSNIRRARYCSEGTTVSARALFIMTPWATLLCSRGLLDVTFQLQGPWTIWIK